MQDAKEEIKSRLAVEDVVGQYVELKRSGRNLKGRSPWGVDKTPSFMVSPEKGIWHDFSANKGGDIFTFIMEVEGVGFREALEKLAGQAGVDLTKYRGGDPQVSRKKSRAREALALATKYYQVCLTRSKNVCEYVFYQRNLNRGTVKEFKIGYAPPSGKALLEVLKKRGFTEEELDAAGLLNRFKSDMFRDRMMVPFIDTTGNVIGFTARILGKGEPKYLNTPDTLLFNKSRFIFGLYQAKESIRRNGFVVIVEGNMDVISSHQAGVKEAVATSGTAMTEQHIKALSNLTSDIRLAYDGDAAGVKATERAIMLAGDLGIDLTVISDYHGAKDPDELIQKDPALWQAAVQKSVPAVEWLLKKYEESVDLSSAPGKRKYSDVALKLLDYIKDEVERASYEEKVAKKLDIDVSILREKGERLNKKLEQSKRHLKKPKTEVKNDTIRKLENNLLALKIFGGVSKTQIPLEIPEDETRLAELELIFNSEHQLSDNTDYEREAKELLIRYNAMTKKQRIKELSEQLENLSEDNEEYDKVLREIRDLQQSK
ncbi:DNA primase [Candidatus Nanosyncoccus alces]|uniref:DNA primase n=1 Tax=Candidatus Nanosyncoccus alces TaxID=2171997 RepID=A0ABY0FLT0_9BACT|nr:DNA primase [Candidatus Nanosyncoccus alces]RYC74631.1 DNA primase [Candidatus Nanosyncoccus alces]